jgi:hypothetical protein
MSAGVRHKRDKASQQKAGSNGLTNNHLQQKGIVKVLDHGVEIGFTSCFFVDRHSSLSTGTRHCRTGLVVEAEERSLKKVVVTTLNVSTEIPLSHTHTHIHTYTHIILPSARGKHELSLAARNADVNGSRPLHQHEQT